MRMASTNTPWPRQWSVIEAMKLPRVHFIDYFPPSVVWNCMLIHKEYLITTITNTSEKKTLICYWSFKMRSLNNYLQPIVCRHAFNLYTHLIFFSWDYKSYKVLARVDILKQYSSFPLEQGRGQRTCYRICHCFLIIL